MLINNFLV